MPCQRHVASLWVPKHAPHAVQVAVMAVMHSTRVSSIGVTIGGGWQRGGDDRCSVERSRNRASGRGCAAVDGKNRGSHPVVVLEPVFLCCVNQTRAVG